MSSEEHPVDALLKMESLQQKNLLSEYMCSDYHDAIVLAKTTPFRKYNFKK